jgi:sugar lactone lactonase YvrE
VTWSEGYLYLAHRPGGVAMVRPDGSSEVIAAGVEVASLAPLPSGRVAAIGARRREILLLDGRGEKADTLFAADSTFAGELRQLAADAGGGIYCSASGDSGGIFYLDTAREFARVAEPNALEEPAGLALSADGETLFASDAGDVAIRAFAVKEGGGLSAPRRFGELYLEDGRYGMERPEDTRSDAGGVAVDRQRRVFVAARLGVQVFAPEGELMGIVSFPEPVVNYPAKWPKSCFFGGADMSTLYALCGDELYRIATWTAGFTHPHR